MKIQALHLNPGDVLVVGTIHEDQGHVSDLARRVAATLDPDGRQALALIGPGITTDILRNDGQAGTP